MARTLTRLAVAVAPGRHAAEPLDVAPEYTDIACSLGGLWANDRAVSVAVDVYCSVAPDDQPGATFAAFLELLAAAFAARPGPTSYGLDASATSDDEGGVTSPGVAADTLPTAASPPPDSAAACGGQP